MVEIEIVEPTGLPLNELLGLYESVGWTTYTRAPELLRRSVSGSHRVATARRDGHLVGLARTISDGATIVYLQDVLIAPTEQRGGLGRRLLTILFDSYGDIRQRVLLTDTEEGQRAFYERLGFTETHDHEPALRAFVRFG
ncbi:ribosomal protein S18 acetylase RimI-like enzyme [Stackebrandtia endophytica]|uniref:Ribosomal protein S18 acetylase RimI-like enzyme n=1 Tax=Stackebrandtia endophytica TaxID=1496996 RepID=A0A543B0Z8_9ACTN|nr:GNAT family N-acetyltransferase [Stackebrandtia endophytica]TQL78515.1 ribosomal protein S18 acetylase RimI-like enzyme [Stackebrandtia endophytica]